MGGYVGQKNHEKHYKPHPPPQVAPQFYPHLCLKSLLVIHTHARMYVRTFYNITCSFNFAGISDSIKHPTRTAGGFRWGKTEQAN